MSAAAEGSLSLTILTPERRLIQNQSVRSVTVVGSEGQVQVLPGHCDFMSVLHTGAFAFEMEGGETVHGALSTGYLEVAGGSVTLLAETLELAKEIDYSRAKEAQKKAESVLQDAAIDEHRFRKYELKLQRALIRQHVSGQAS